MNKFNETECVIDFKFSITEGSVFPNCLIVYVIYVILRYICIGLDKPNKLSIKLYMFSYPSILGYVLCAQKNCLIETVLLSTHTVCFG